MLLNPLVERLKADFGLSAVTAAEVEFYLHGYSKREPIYSMDKFFLDTLDAGRAAHIPYNSLLKEKGDDQFEMVLGMSPDPTRTVEHILGMKKIMHQAATTHDLKADFSAKPLESEPGSGLHIHIHLADTNEKNVFYKDDHAISDHLKHSIGGLLAWLPDSMPVFAPKPESYTRFVAKSNAPVTASWGANNRTVAIRLPDKPHQNKHIEHRVAGADADPEKVMAVMLAAIHDGLTRKLDPGQQIYGDASLPMYQLPLLPQTLEEGMKRMKESEAIRKYFEIEELL